MIVLDAKKAHKPDFVPRHDDLGSQGGPAMPWPDWIRLEGSEHGREIWVADLDQLPDRKQGTVEVRLIASQHLSVEPFHQLGARLGICGSERLERHIAYVRVRIGDKLPDQIRAIRTEELGRMVGDPGSDDRVLVLGKASEDPLPRRIPSEVT